MEFFSFPKHSTLLGLHLHPLPTTATAFTAGIRLGLNQTSHPDPGTNMQRGENPPWEHLQCLQCLLSPADPMATCCPQKGSGPGLSYHVSPRAAELGLLQRVTRGTSCSGTYAEHISHSPSRLSQELKELGPFSLS